MTVFYGQTYKRGYGGAVWLASYVWVAGICLSDPRSRGILIRERTSDIVCCWLCLCFELPFFLLTWGLDHDQ